MVEPVLCYVTEPWAFFTTLPLSEQWGDDWDDVPYEYNASRPSPSEQMIMVGYSGDFCTPADMAGQGGSRYSVEMINAGAVAWLVKRGYKKSDKSIAILAGTPLSEFKKLIVRGGGKVFLAESDHAELSNG